MHACMLPFLTLPRYRVRPQGYQHWSILVAYPVVSAPPQRTTSKGVSLTNALALPETTHKVKRILTLMVDKWGIDENHNTFLLGPT